MTFLNAAYRLLIGPLELFFETVFTLANHVFHNPGLSIIFLCLAMNLLVLPLYRRADAMQKEERDKEEKLKKWSDHIKKTFHGDEKFMILQTYYRQNGYKQTDALKGSISLLLEIPFFIAAYQFLSHLTVLDGTRFGIIKNLGAPDTLLRIAGIKINVLPVLMTGVNLLSAAIYMKGFPLKSKVQMIGMALIFLVLLYQSPSGLVFYWTLNNVFSLCKNICYKLKEKGMVSLPVWIKRKEKKEDWPDPAGFFFNAVLLAVLSGLLIPSAVIRSSTQEFINIMEYQSPLWFIVSAALYAFGTFVIWFGIFFWLAGKKGKRKLEKGIWLFSCTAIVDYMFFGTDYGILSSLLVYETAPRIDRYCILKNFGVLFLVWMIAWLIQRYRKKVIRFAAFCIALAFFTMTVLNITAIRSSSSKLSKTADAVQTKEQAHFTFSKTGKNVVVLMLDRGIGAFVPFIMKEKPELQKKFAGFTYYPNTISYGKYTLMGSPALFGGYEYTPESMNERPKTLLKDKHNEALKLMPVIFDQNGYQVTVCDPTYAEYQWVPDLSIYDEYPDIKKYITLGKFDTNSYYDGNETDPKELQDRNFFCYSLFRMVPQVMQPYLYDSGHYNRAEMVNAFQTMDGITKAEGLQDAFLKPYAVLSHLSGMTEITEKDVNTFLMMTNDTTHEPMLLQEPEYEPEPVVDNTHFEGKDAVRESTDGRTASIANENDMIHYHANMASLLKVADWLDYLRENEVYDNTRIILVADHGRGLDTFESTAFPTLPRPETTFFNPILMVKDFGSREFKTDEQFMTNADTPTLAFQGLIGSPVNPFTGNAIDNKKKQGDQEVTDSDIWDFQKNNGTTFLPGDWYSVHPGNIFDPDNWSFIGENVVSPK